MLNRVLKFATLAGALLLPGIAAAAAPAIVTTDLNIRTGPGVAYQRFGTIAAGDRVTVHGCLTGYNWCDVSWTGDRGWVSGDYLAYLGNRYDRRPISSIGVSIGLPVVGFDPYAYHGRHYVDRPWYRDRYIEHRRERWEEERRDRQREMRREWRDRQQEERREDRREVRRERRDVQEARKNLREERRDLIQARRAGEDVAKEQREVRRALRILQQEQQDLRDARRY